MSRMTMALLLAAAAPASAGAAPNTAEQALANYKQVFKTPRELDCPRGEDEIVVCGTAPEEASRYRVPFEPEPGARVIGDASGMAAMSAGGCLRLCHRPVKVDLIGGTLAVIKGVKRIIEGDD